MSENRLLPAKVSQHLLVSDLLLLEWPHIPTETARELLWEVTGFPSFWMTTPEEPQPIHVLRRQMREFREDPKRVCAQIEYDMGWADPVERERRNADLTLAAPMTAPLPVRGGPQE